MSKMSRDEIITFIKGSIEKMYNAKDIQEIEELEKQLKSTVYSYATEHPALIQHIQLNEIEFYAVINHAKSRLTISEEAFQYGANLADLSYKAILRVFEFPH